MNAKNSTIELEHFLNYAMKDGILSSQRLRSTTNIVMKIRTVHDIFVVKKFLSTTEEVCSVTERFKTESSTLRKCGGVLSVPRMYLCDKKRETIVTEWIDGQVFQNLSVFSPKIKDLVKSLAKWLVEFHTFFEKHPPLPIRSNIQYAINALRSISNQAISQSERNYILKALFQKAKTLRATYSVYCRGDSFLTNFIVANNYQLFGIDFEQSRYGDPAKDVGEACSSLLRLKPGFREENYKLAKMLVKTYEELCGHKISERIPLYLVYSFIVQADAFKNRQIFLLHHAVKFASLF